MSVKFLRQPDKSGWLTVRRADNNSRISLPRYLKVQLIDTRPDSRLDANKKRDFFKALEGSYKGVQFSVARKDDGSSFLGEGRHLVAGVIKFKRSTEQLWYGENGPVYAITDNVWDPIPLGTFDLEIPDHPHGLGRSYINRASYATVWFRIRPGGANTITTRYLHTGTISAGCTTVKDVDKWNNIYSYLIGEKAMSALGQLLCLSKRVALLISLSTTLLVLSGCNSVTTKSVTDEKGSNTSHSNKPSSLPKNKTLEDQTIPKEAVALDQKEMFDIEALLKQVQRAGPAEEKAAKVSLSYASKAKEKKQWGPAAKAHGEAVSYKPSTESLIGYADAIIMLDRIRPTKKESLEIKLREFEGAVKLYRITIELNERLSTPLSAEQRNEIEEKIKCLETFVKNPNPEFPICQLVKDALAESKIK